MHNLAQLRYTALRSATLCCTTLHCAALRCAALRYTVLRSAALRCALLHCAALRCTALRSATLCCAPLHCVTLRNTVLHYAALRCATLCCVVLHCAALRCAKPNAQAPRRPAKVFLHTVEGATFRHQADHRSHRGPAKSRSRRVLPGAGCRNPKACGTCDYKCGYGCVVWHMGFKNPFIEFFLLSLSLSLKHVRWS
eukprot:364457-Chlamydomonas_euryale.AAC.8